MLHQHVEKHQLFTSDVDVESWLKFGRHGVAMLMSVFVQNIVDMIVDYALWVAVLKKEFSKIMEGRL